MSTCAGRRCRGRPRRSSAASPRSRSARRRDPGRATSLRSTESRSIAATTSSLTLLGRSTVTALSPNATTPIRIVAGCCSTNARAARLRRLDAVSARGPRPACCSTRRRRGSPCLRDRGARGSRSAVRARSDEREREREERERDVPAPAGALTGASSVRALRTRAGPRARRVGGASTSTRRRAPGTTTSARSIQGEPRDISGAAACAASTMRTSALTRSSSVETSWMSTPARRVAARSSASRSSPARRSRCRNSASLESTVSCSPVSASSTTITPASGSSYSRGSSEADRDDLVALGQLQQRPLPTRWRDEVGDEHDEGAAPDGAEGVRRAAPTGR